MYIISEIGSPYNPIGKRHKYCWIWKKNHHIFVIIMIMPQGMEMGE